MAIKRHIPNTITCCNLFSGCIACVMALVWGDFLTALLFIVIGATFDFFDGMVARLLKVSSPLGVQMDSLADDVTFGLAPAAIVFSFMRTLPLPAFLVPVGEFLPYYAFVIAVFSAVRLAKFNIDTRQKSTFIGLPTPANALFWASLVAGLGGWITELNAGWLFIMGLITLFSYLLVSPIPMFSLKFKSLRWRSNKIRYIFLVCSIPMLFLGIGAAVAIIAWYLMLSTALYVRKKMA